MCEGVVAQPWKARRLLLAIAARQPMRDRAGGADTYKNCLN